MWWGMTTWQPISAHSFAVCSLDESAVDADGVTLKGNLRLSVMACEINDDGMPSYVGLKIDVPFSEKVKPAEITSKQVAKIGHDLCCAVEGFRNEA